MLEQEILKLKRKVEELCNKYEQAKKQREDLVTEMEKLDNKIEKLETIKEKNSQNKNLKKNLTKNSLKLVTVEILGITLINLILYRFQFYLLQIAVLMILNTSELILVYKKKKEPIPKNINIKNIETELSQTIEKRYTIGTKYKNIREEELLYKRNYEIVKESLENTLKTLEQGNHKTYKPINLNDIYSKIKMTPEEYIETTENKINIFNKKLKEYLISKIIENKNKPFLSKILFELTMQEVMIILISCIPEKEHHNTLNHIIHAILGFISNLQNYSIVWSEESNEKLISNPEMIIDELGRYSELKTHPDTDYLKIFETVYDILLDKFNTKTNKRIFRKQ